MAGGDSPEARTASIPLARIQWQRTSRLIASRYPTVGVFDRVASPADLDALFELEGWTNDRLSHELGLLSYIPRDEWITGPMASVVMAAFCHPHPGGARFSSATRGAWYAARTFATALAESVHRRTQELIEVGTLDLRVEMRLYHADFSADFHDVRRRTPTFTRLHHPSSYVASQHLAEDLLDQRIERRRVSQRQACGRRVPGVFQAETGAPRARRRTLRVPVGRLADTARAQARRCMIRYPDADPI